MWRIAVPMCNDPNNLKFKCGAPLREKDDAISVAEYLNEVWAPSVAERSVPISLETAAILGIKDISQG